jgi:hypothetical protein
MCKESDTTESLSESALLDAEESIVLKILRLNFCNFVVRDQFLGLFEKLE